MCIHTTNTCLELDRRLWRWSSVWWDGIQVLTDNPYSWTAITRLNIYSSICIHCYNNELTLRLCWPIESRVVLSEAVDLCIYFTRKIQHGGDWERSRPQGPKNVHNFLLTVLPLSWARGHVTEVLLILKKLFSTWLFDRKSYLWPSREMSHDFVRGQSVAETCFSHWG